MSSLCNIIVQTDLINHQGKMKRGRLSCEIIIISFVINNNIKLTNGEEFQERVFIIFLVNICREVSPVVCVDFVLFCRAGICGHSGSRGDKERNITQTDRQITQETSLGIQLRLY